MAFDRDAAIRFADRFWNIPCDDGIFWVTNDVVSIERKRTELGAKASDGWEPRFVDDGGGGEEAVFLRTVGGRVERKRIQPWEGLADCAHFLSRCLTSGGATINERGVAQLINALQSRSDTKTLAEKVTQERGQRIVNSGVFKPGDMIGYFNIDPSGDFGGRQAYSHSTMYAGKLKDAAGKEMATDEGRVTCHTICRFPGRSFVEDRWFLHSGYSYTFIHFSGDDLAPLPAIAAALPGWWKVEYGIRVEYYYIFKDGRARYTLLLPKANVELHAAEGSAYWFQTKPDKITFTWRKTGTVEVWTQTGDPRAFDIKVNDTAGKSTKMF